MSTKTTFKRIALVAVAALGLSVVAVVPSKATNSADVMTLGATASAATTLVAVSTTVSITGVSDSTPAGAVATAVLMSAPLTSTSANILPVFTYTADQVTANTAANAGATGTGTSAVTITPVAAGRFTGTATLTVTPDVPGVYVYRITPSGSVNTTTAQTWTVTAVAPTVKSITAFLNVDTASATADASSLSYAAASSVTAKGALVVRQFSTTDTATAATTAISELVTVAISRGLVSKTNDFFAGAKSVTTAAAGSTNGRSEYYVFANGEVGTATLTVTVGAFTSTKTITFQGVATTLSAALTAGQRTWITPTAGATNTTTVTVTAKDSAGNAAIALPTTMTATPASTAIATATINSSTGVVTITGVAAGTTVITIADSATTAPAASATYTVTVAPAASATLPTLTFDKAEYNAGELMTITIGAAAADNPTFAAFTSAGVASSVSLVNVLNPFTSGAVALVGGKATWTAYAPITAGPITLTAMSGAGSSLTSAEVKATATVISDGVAQAAADAAAEAKDAADAATDAANEAAAAADAATAAAQDAADAVNDLAASVSAMITALRKQITALTNLVIKIQKKVRA